MNNQITDQLLQNVQRILSTSKPGKTYSLNLADDLQYNYMTALYQMNGMTPERYPQTFKNLDIQRQVDLAKGPGAPVLNKMGLGAGIPGFSTLAQITSVGTSGNGTQACATGFLAVQGGVTAATLSLNIYDNTDPQQPKLLAQSTVNIGTTNFIPIQAVGGTPTNNMYALFTFTYTPVGGQPIGPQYQTLGNAVGLADPIVIEPVQKPTHTSNANIRIALSRGDFNRNNDDVDYWFNVGQWDNITIIVPFVGSATFANPVDLSTLQLNLVVALEDGGASVTPSAPVDLQSFFTLSADQKTLSWNFPANGATPGSNGNPIVYGTAPWVSDTITYFFASVGINPVGSQLTQWVYVQSTDIADEIDNDGINYIKPLVFLWHCLAEGTCVTLADGSTLPIEKVDNSHKVKINQKGDTLPVLATTLGNALTGEVYKLITSDKQELILSSKHLVITSNGAVPADKLEVGANILLEKGTSKVASIQKISHSGKLYNLELGTDGNVPQDGSSFFANGILVGDFQMQSAHHRKSKRNKELVLKNLPKEWHVDYLSHLEDEQAKQKKTGTVLTRQNKTETVQTKQNKK